MDKNLFDIVVPVGPNDREQINLNIHYNSKNIIGYRNFYAVVYDTSIELPDNIIKIDEKIFPFNINDIAHYHGKIARNGWYLQQLIKLYASFVIPDILDRYLVIDSDTFFLKPTVFVDTENNKCLYNVGTEYHLPYFEHMKKLNSKLEKVHENFSGICHHMIFEKKYVIELFNMIEDKYLDKNEAFKFWKLFLIYSYEQRDLSGASEYEIYFNYICKFHKDEIIIRKLNWQNVNNLQNINDYDYISYHWYSR